MIIADYKYGRLGNRLDLAAQLIIFSSLFNVPVAILFAKDLGKYFPYFSDNSWMIYPKECRIRSLSKISLFLVLAAKKIGLFDRVDFLKENKLIFFDRLLRSDKLIAPLLGKKIIFFKGWRFRSSKITNDQALLLRSIFTPNKDILARAKKIRDILNSEIIIGVHIRWGDLMKEHSPFFYPIDRYIKVMQQFLFEMGNKKIGFIVCSEEDVIKHLSHFNCVYSGGNPIEDIYTLSEADYIISNGSTFSRWASFWGAKPMYTINKSGSDFLKDNLKIFSFDFSMINQDDYN